MPLWQSQVLHVTVIGGQEIPIFAQKWANIVAFTAITTNKNERGYLSCLAACVAVALISPPEGGASIPRPLYFYYSIQASAAEAAGATNIIIARPYGRHLISNSPSSIAQIDR